MRVRHLQSHLSEQNLVHSESLEKLRGVKVGVDAVFWLRSIQALKDPFADALGGIPPGIFGFVDKELEFFKKYDIQPLFIFQGVAPGPQHSMFVSRMDQQMESAWGFLAKGQKSDAQKCFAVSTSRINGDFVYFIFHHLKHKGYECLNAPYFAGAQLAHFAEQGVVQAVFGAPGLLLFGVQSVVMHIDVQRATFDWVDLQAVLLKWGISRDQFVEACMLAGTEYCLTYPYLNLGNFPNSTSTPGRFNFDHAVHIIKQAPLINWMQTFPTEEMKTDHVEGYCICKILVQHCPVLNLQDNAIRPLGAGQAGGIPNDFRHVMGEKLPSNLYYLMLNGIMSHKLPQALAKGEWTDKSQPLVDTKEFRELLSDLADYRQKSLGLIAKHLHDSFKHKQILCKAFWDNQNIRHIVASDANNLPKEARILIPSDGKGLRWDIRKQAVEDEMKRQETHTIDFKFCLKWHANEYNTNGPLIQNLKEPGTPMSSNDRDSLQALVHMMVLEHLDLIDADDGSMTVLGNVLKESPRNLQEPCLVALEMMKFGILNGAPYDPASEDARAFPEAVNYPSSDTVDDQTKAEFLLARVMSLVPMKLRNDMWNADVDFDLAAFHALVRILKRALRQLVEASMASVLLEDLTRVKLLPQGFMCASPTRGDYSQTPAMLPTFMLPRACMGIVVNHFLHYKGDPQSYLRHVQQMFPCCVQPVEDLKNAFAFWEDLKRCVNEIAEPLGATELRDDMWRASELLYAKQKQLNIYYQSPST